MKNFEDELDVVFNAHSEKFSRNNCNSAHNGELVSHVYGVFKGASDYLNKKSESDLINLVTVPSDLNSLLFNFEGGNGFLITFGKSKLVLVLFESSSFVTFVGKLSEAKDKNIKLLRLEVECSKRGEFRFRDNSGLKVRLHEVALQVIKWGIS